MADIDDIFHEQLKDFLLNETDVKEYISKGDDRLQKKTTLLENMQSKLAKVRKDIKELIDLRIKGELNAETLAPYIKPLEEQARQLGYQLSALEAEVGFLKIDQLSSETVLHGAKHLYRNWKTLPFEEKRSIIEVITKDIVIGKTAISINLSYQPTTRRHFSPNGGNSARSNYHTLGLTEAQSTILCLVLK